MMKKSLILFMFFLFLVQCNNVPARRINDDLKQLVHIQVSQKQNIKIDFLWMIDNSSSMCQEQNSLAENFQVFLDELNKFSNLDLRIAVVTTDIYTPGIKGCFMHKPADSFPPACEVNYIKECYEDADCSFFEEKYGKNWACIKPSKLSNVVNTNGSVNSRCHKYCSEDNECIEYFGPDYFCNLAPSNEGCMKPPQTQNCPSGKSLPTVLDNSNIEYFPCIATVGAEQNSVKANIEAGIKSVWLALYKGDDICETTNCNYCDLYSKIQIDSKLNEIDKLLPELNKAINSTPDPDKKAYYTKAKDYFEKCKKKLEKCDYFINASEPNFLREDAYLVIIFISDEDDCSPQDGKEFSSEDTKKCSFKYNILAPVKQYVNRFKSLKKDPSKIIVVGIYGDALIEGSNSCIVPDECIEVRKIKGDPCSCYSDEGRKDPNCPKLLQAAQDKDWCSDNPSPDNCFLPENKDKEECKPLLEEELSYRLECLDSCLGKKDTKPDKKCSKLVPECACYDENNRNTEKCKKAFEDEISYRKECIRSCFIKAKKDSQYVPNIVPYVCLSSNGMADYGGRYKELVEGFGKHGIFTNICSSEGIGGSLKKIASSIIQIVTRICLPKEPENYDGEYEIVVMKTSPDGNTVTLKEGEDYTIVNAQECDTQKAVFFRNVPAPDEKIQIIYQAKTDSSDNQTDSQ